MIRPLRPLTPPRRTGTTLHSRAPRPVVPPRAPRPSKRRRSGAFWPHLAWILPMLLVDFLFFRWIASPDTPAPPPAALAAGTVVVSRGGPAAPHQAIAPLPPPPPPPVWASMVAPTPQHALDTPDVPGVLQPTASGRIESAKFGSTRRDARGLPRFHEGVDIAATARDRRGRPTDPVYAVADGRVAFVNTVAGNSTYGKYVVIEHPDPSLGVRTNASGTVTTSVVYTLYAHLSDVRFGVRIGASVEAGEEIATMGNTSSTTPPIPWQRAHLHWEIGLMLNSRYEARNRETKQNIPFGNYNGFNLFGLDPLDFWAARARNPDLTFAAYLASRPVAMVLILRGKAPDFFIRNPGLWEGELPKPDGGVFAVSLSESGAPVHGRPATPEEIAHLGNRRAAVWAVDRSVLGHNARAYVVERNGAWQITDAGKKWAERFFE